MNVSIIMGRLTTDPELRHTSSDLAVTSFTVAVDRYTKPGEDKKADFIEIIAWRAKAEFVCKYFKKGQSIAIKGSIQTGSYTDKEGVKRKTFSIVADEAYFCGDKPKNDDAAPRRGVSPNPTYSSSDNSGFEEISADDDLPF